MTSNKFVPCIVVLGIFIAAVCGVQAQDVSRGKIIFEACAGCHGIQPRSDDQAPSLGGLIGRRAGTVPGFDYSTAMLSANFVWNEATLDAFLADPQAVVPGTRMPYSVAAKDERADIIAYLKTLQ